LAWAEARSLAGALLAGSIFTFSSYHFAHAAGHLQLVSLEWLPLVLLSWRHLVSRQTAAAGVLSALALFLVILCDYYYFAFCLLAAGVMLAASRRRRGLRGFATTMAPPLTICVLTALATSGVLVVGLARTAYGDGLIGSHPAAQCSLDLLALVVPGSYWRFADLTWPYWSRLPVNRNEASAHLGLVVTA